MRLTCWSGFRQVVFQWLASETALYCNCDIIPIESCIRNINCSGTNFISGLGVVFNVMLRISTVCQTNRNVASPIASYEAHNIYDEPIHIVQK